VHLKPRGYALDWLAFADAWPAPCANVEEDVVFFESTAILNYLEATRPTPLLVPADGLLRHNGSALVDARALGVGHLRRAEGRFEVLREPKRDLMRSGAHRAADEGLA
jgi:glutathione S-transferase